MFGLKKISVKKNISILTKQKKCDKIRMCAY